MTHASESGHWYYPDGKPAYQVQGAKGLVTPDIRHARKFGLLPGVTTIIRQAAAPGLERWKQQQILLAAMTLPRGPEQSESDWMQAVARDAQEQGRNAAERGTAIHKAIQERDLKGEYAEHVIGTLKELKTAFNGAEFITEQSFAHPLGFGGKVDDHAPQSGIVLDYKTKEFGPDAELDTYDEHHMQLAAYREGLGMPNAKCAIVYVSVTVPGLAKVLELGYHELEQGWGMFQALLTYFKVKNRLA